MHRKTALHCAFFALSLVYAGTMIWLVTPQLQGRVLPSAKPPAWLTITEQQVESGATIPAGTNVLFHLPFDMPTITRSVLLGPSGKTIRYWGYCFPDEYIPDPNKPGLPGKVFLSEAERKWRRDAEKAYEQQYSIYNPPPRNPRLLPAALRTIRHQIERFSAGLTCYVMTERALPIGTDRDFDGLNAQMEKQYKTDPQNADTDGDGITDGLEVHSLGTSPTLRDSDGDGLIDGIEDHNRNGVFEPGETDPRKRDTDGDGLCDGNCRISESRTLCRDLAGRDCVTLPYDRWEGEDKNLNGLLDLNETDPRLRDTDGDGILDDQEYYNCVMERGKNC